MLAVLGFGITAILFYLFATTFANQGTKHTAHIFKDYARAYYLLCLAFLTYASVSAFSERRVLAWGVILGNVLLLAATVLIVGILVAGKYRKHYMVLTAFLGVVGILVRVFYFYPKPYMYRELLFFNSQRFVSFTLSAVFLLLWLPVNLHISSIVTNSKKAASLGRYTPYLYTLATLSAMMFLLSKEPLPLVMSFTALALSFLALIAANVYVKPLRSTHGKQ